MTTDARDFPQSRPRGAAQSAPARRADPSQGRIPGQARRRLCGLPIPFEPLREQGRAIRDSALSRLDELLIQFETNVKAAGGHVHWARDAAEACAIVTRILSESGARTVTKGKSMATEEIELNAHLSAQGIAPVETDLGEYIIQLRGERPSHIVAPAFHLRRADVEASFREAHQSLPPARGLDNRPALVSEARAVLRRHFEAADAGITGANFLVAETGTAIIVTNEGNGDLTRLLPRTHIVVTGIEKVVPRLDDASILLRLLTRSATGQEITSYVSFMSGPKRRAMRTGRKISMSCCSTMGAARCWAARARGAAMHPLRRLPQSLPGLWRDRRPCLWRDLSRAAGRRARSGARRSGQDLSSAECDQLLRPLRNRLPGEDSAHPHHAPLAQ